GGPPAAHDAADEADRAEVRAGRAAAREAVPWGERQRQAPELVLRYGDVQPAGPRERAGREPPVPVLLRGGPARGRAAPGPGARERRVRGQRPPAGRERGAARDHLGVPG